MSSILLYWHIRANIIHMADAQFESSSRYPLKISEHLPITIIVCEPKPSARAMMTDERSPKNKTDSQSDDL